MSFPLRWGSPLRSSPERVDAVGEADESGTACRIGSSGAIVADREFEETVTRVDGDVHGGSVRVIKRRAPVKSLSGWPRTHKLCLCRCRLASAI